MKSNLYELIDENKNSRGVFNQKREAKLNAKLLLETKAAKSIDLKIEWIEKIEIKNIIAFDPPSKKIDEKEKIENWIIKDQYIQEIKNLKINFSYSWISVLDRNKELFYFWALILMMNQKMMYNSINIDDLKLFLKSYNDEKIKMLLNKLIQLKLITKQKWDKNINYWLITNHLQKENEIVLTTENENDWNYIFTYGLNEFYKNKINNKFFNK